MTREEFIKNADLGEEIVNGRIQIFTQGLENQCDVEITEFPEIGLESVEDYNEENYSPFSIVSYLEDHPDHEIWDELFERV